MSPDRLRIAIRVGIYGLVLLAPLPFGSVQPWAVLAMELAAAALGCAAIVLLSRDSAASAPIERLPFVLCGGVLLLGLIQILPLPLSLSAWFNPTADLMRPLIPYLEVGRSPAVAWSVAPSETTDAILRFTAYVFVALATAVSFDDEGSRRRLALVLVASAAFQAVYGSGEYLTGRQHIFGFAKKHYLDSATGTFINRNHFATLLAVALPFAVALAMPPQSAARARAGWRERLIAASDSDSLTRLLAAICAAIIWLGLLLSHSRAGLLAALLGVAIVLMHHRRAHAARWAAVIGGGVLVALLSIEVAEAPGERFLTLLGDLETRGGRLTVWQDASSLVRARPILGWGFGAFETSFRHVQSSDIALNYDHAHNDWLEWWVEGGLLGLGLALAICVQLLRGADVGTRAALAAIAAHGLWDFSLRIPAIALVAAVVAGVATTGYARRTSSRAAVTAFPPPSTKVSNQISRLSRFQIR